MRPTKLPSRQAKIKYIDLFCGIGGFRIGAENAFKKLKISASCVLSADIDDFARKAYFSNFHEWPEADITKIPLSKIPDHDLLLAGFPCQPFSIIGSGKGFEDVRGTLFFEIAKIIKKKKPDAFILENVKRLKGHKGGSTFKTIINTLSGLGYFVDYKILNALDFGLPQKRERIFIVGTRSANFFSWPQPNTKAIPLNEILEKAVDRKFYVSENIRIKRHKKHTPKCYPSIWHENKSGNISSYPFSCALRAGASHNYLLVNGERRLTPREMLRLQGFPDTFKIVCSDGQTKKQAGNAVPVPIVERLITSLTPLLLEYQKSKKPKAHAKLPV